MALYAPGSFTKNFSWNKFPPGLSRLHTVIKAGFGGVASPVRREIFRQRCGISDPNVQLIPINFFLHNTVTNNANYVTADELVRHAINNPHSRRFDQLAIFSMHLSRMGRRTGVAGSSRGAAFARDFVRTRTRADGNPREGDNSEVTECYSNGFSSENRSGDQEARRAGDGDVVDVQDDGAPSSAPALNRIAVSLPRRRGRARQLTRAMATSPVSIGWDLAEKLADRPAPVPRAPPFGLPARRPRYWATQRSFGVRQPAAI